MSRLHVAHAEIKQFADEKVNLKREDVEDLRDQVNRLRDKLEQYLRDHPSFSLKKMMISGSLAKGTSLKSIGDIDVAMYVSNAEAPSNVNDLIPWLATRLRTAFPNFKSDQIKENLYTVTIFFSTTGLKIDIVPIFYAGDENWRGHLVSKQDGSKILTSIPMHLNFIRKRKETNNTHYAQIVRLMKYWIKYQKSINPNIKFKSFMIELLVAYLVDHKLLTLDNYPESLADIFSYIARDGFNTEIAFSDHYDLSKLPNSTDPIKIWDPVNHENNTARMYTESHRQALIEAALEAGDAIDSALYAPTKTDTVRYWQKVFGPSFDF